jgi:DNA-binding LacI/PurR family transcriptional regulator
MQRDGYHVLLFIADTRQTDAVLAEILQYQVDGVVLASTSMSSALALRCSDAGMPVVLFNRTVQQHGRGHQFGHHRQLPGRPAGGPPPGSIPAMSRIAYIAGLEDTSTNQLTASSGLRDGLAEHGQKRCFARAVGNYDFEEAKLAARHPVRRPGARSVRTRSSWPTTTWRSP